MIRKKIDAFFRISSERFGSEDELITARMVAVINSLYTFCFGTYTILGALLENYQVAFLVNAPVTLLLGLLTLALRYTNKHRMLAIAGNNITAIALIFIYHLTGNLYSPNSVWFYGLIIGTFLTVGVKATWATLLLLCAGLIVNFVAYFTFNFSIATPKFGPGDRFFELYISITQLLGIIIIGLGVHTFYVILKLAYQQAKQAKEKIELQNRQLDEQRIVLENQQKTLLLQKDQLEENNDKLKELDKQKTHFFQNISHELRTPLTLILSSLRKLDNEDRNIQVLTRNSQRLYRLVNQLLDFQKLAANEYKPRFSSIAVTPTLAGIAESFRLASEEKQVKFSFNIVSDVGHDDLMIQADIDSFEKVIFNFLSNALKFTPINGTIDLTVTFQQGHALIQVLDSGPGISKKDQSRLFKTFSQIDSSTKREYEGTGLGLALAKELTLRMNGTIGVESDTGKGSCFWVKFPLAQEISKPIDLLYVYVDEEAKIQFETIVSQKNYHWNVRMVATEEEAKQVITMHKTYCILADMQLNEGDEAGVFAFAMDSQKDAKRVLLTNVSTPNNRMQRAFNLGRINRVLTKPLSSESLSSLDELIRQGQVNDQREVTDVLIVDDEPAQLRRLYQVLGDMDEIGEIVEASNFLEGRRFILERRLKCIISDANLEGNSGIDLLSYAESIQPMALRIMITGDERPEIFDAAIRDKTVHHILYKPYDRQELQIIVQRAIQDFNEKFLQPTEQRTSSKDWLLADARSYEPEKARDEKEKPTPLTPLYGRILVADDVPDMRDMICECLNLAGFQTVAVADGAQALEEARKNPPDLLISDWMMPKLSGPELIRAFEQDERLKSVPTILLTAKGDVSRKEGLVSGVTAYLSKPFEDIELISTIRNLWRLKESERKVIELNKHLTETVLSRSFPPELVADISRGEFSFDREPQLVTVTIMFVDLCDFSQKSTDLGPRRVSGMLNQFFHSMTEVIFEHEGIVDKFTGDGLLSIFGAPKEQNSKAQVENAIICAQLMESRLMDLNHIWQKQFEVTFSMRIGIHTGPAVVGIFGGERRSEYTVIGPTVNLAARIQAAAQPGEILVSQVVRDYIDDGSWEPAGSFMLKGIGSTPLFRIIQHQAGNLAKQM